MDYFSKKIISFSLIVMYVFVAIAGLIIVSQIQAVPAQAQAAFDICSGPENNATDTAFCKELGEADTSQGGGIFGPNSVLTRVTEAIIFISSAVALLMIVIGGFRYVLSQGDPQATQNAKNTIIYAIVGLVIAISSQVILSVVLSRI